MAPTSKAPGTQCKIKQTLGTIDVQFNGTHYTKDGVWIAWVFCMCVWRHTHELRALTNIAYARPIVVPNCMVAEYTYICSQVWSEYYTWIRDRGSSLQHTQCAPGRQHRKHWRIITNEITNHIAVSAARSRYSTAHVCETDARTWPVVIFRMRTADWSDPRNYWRKADVINVFESLIRSCTSGWSLRLRFKVFRSLIMVFKWLLYNTIC